VNLDFDPPLQEFRADLDRVLACEEIGRHAVPGPDAVSIVAIPTMLARSVDVSPVRYTNPSSSGGFVYPEPVKGPDEARQSGGGADRGGRECG
jgi:hypothetical protein